MYSVTVHTWISIVLSKKIDEKSKKLLFIFSDAVKMNGFLNNIYKLNL